MVQFNLQHVAVQFTQYHLWRDGLFSITYYSLLCRRLIDYISKALFCSLYSNPLIYVSLLYLCVTFTSMCHFYLYEENQVTWTLPNLFPILISWLHLHFLIYMSSFFGIKNVWYYLLLSLCNHSLGDLIC